MLCTNLMRLAMYATRSMHEAPAHTDSVHKRHLVDQTSLVGCFCRCPKVRQHGDCRSKKIHLRITSHHNAMHSNCLKCALPQLCEPEDAIKINSPLNEKGESRLAPQSTHGRIRFAKLTEQSKHSWRRPAVSHKCLKEVGGSRQGVLSGSCPAVGARNTSRGSGV